MHIAQNIKKLTLVMLLVLLSTLFFALPASADDAISFTLSVEPSALPAPGPVNVSIRVVNEGSADMTEPVLVYDPDGQLVTGFGDGGQALLKKGDIVAAQHSYQVTQEQLDAGQLTYTLSYNQITADGKVVVQSQLKTVDLTYTGTHVDLKVNRTIDPEVVRRGETVTVQYELYNAGNVEIKNIRIRENSSLSGNSQTLQSLAPGARDTIKFIASMGGQDLTSEGKVTYKAEEQSYNVDLPAVTITRATPGLNLDNILTADKTSIESGDTVTLTLSIRNDGNITYSNITVTDQKYGELFTNLTLAPGETLVREKQFILSETTNFKYTVILPDNTGTTSTVSSKEIKVSVYDPSQVLHLNVLASASTSTVSRIPSDVDFTVTVTNNSSFEAKNITFSHGSVRFYTVEKLAPSESVTVTRSFHISQTGRFRFTVSAKDALDNTVTFDSNEMTVSYAAPTDRPTSKPTVSVAPLVTVTTAPISVLEPVTLQTNRILRYAVLVLGALFAVTFVLFVISSIIRGKRRSASKKAYDHMDLGGKRDYTVEAPYTASETATDPADAMDDIAIEKPSDAILKESAAPVAAKPTEEGNGYRLTREDVQTPAPSAQPAAEDAPAEPRRRRSKRSNGPSEDE